jgi:hypothetical protein
MRNLLRVGLVSACLGLCGCGTVDPQAVAPITEAITAGLPHCHISGSLNAGAGGLAGSGTGVAQYVTFDCPGQPWTAPSAAAVADSMP